MAPRRSAFVTACQQALALAVVATALTPAAGVVSLEVVGQPPSAGPPSNGRAGAASPGPDSPSLAAYSRANAVPSRVPTAVVEPDVDEYQLTSPHGARVAPQALQADEDDAGRAGTEVTSRPEPVTGYGAVGVTWQHGVTPPEGSVAVRVRTRHDGVWSSWTPVGYDPEHGPDPGSEEARHARPGTDVVLVGDVDRVQVQVRTEQQAPPDMRLSVIDPGSAVHSELATPAIDTAALDDAAARAPATAVPMAEATPTTLPTVQDDSMALQAATYTPKPRIYSRAQWGADESMRDKSSLHYFEVHAGFVHHTVNANDYTRAEVPALLRSIYAYHVRSRGWSDIGYNFLVDRFGRIWEGRYGGVDRPVVGAHTLGYNDDAFAMSAIGNFETVRPSSAMLGAYGALFAWKLSLHGVDAASTRQWVASRYFPAINGHRDAASTACPGRYLYARLGRIRTLADEAQRGWSGRELESDLYGKPYPDLVARRASDGKGFILPLRGGATPTVGRPIPTGVDLSNVNRVLNAGDWDRDGRSDLITRNRSNGALYFRRGLGDGKFGSVRLLARDFGRVSLLAAVGDMTGDGWPDLMGQPVGGAMRIYPGRGLRGLKRSYVAYSAIGARRQVPVGRHDTDGAPDSLLRSRSTLTLYRGNGPGGFVGSRQLSLDVGRYDWVVGISDIGVTGHSDLVVRARSTGTLWLVPMTASGFGVRQLLGSGMDRYDLVG